MNKLAPVTAAVALLAVTSIATAATMPKSNSGSGSAAPASPMSQSTTKDSLSLSASQQSAAWKDISAQAVKETAPAGFTAKVGAAVPNGLVTQPVPVSTASEVPDLRAYQYALLDNGKLLIINPADHKVAEIITKS